MDWNTYMSEINEARVKGWNEARAQVGRIIGVRRAEGGLYMLDENTPHSASQMITKLFDELWSMED